MKKILYGAGAALLCIAAASPCFAANSQWNGTWKVNLAKSKLTGDTFSITKKVSGIYDFTNGSTISYQFACNGNAYPTIANRTVTCTGSLGQGYNFTTKAGPTVIEREERFISPDGNTMTVKGTTMLPGGRSTSFQETYKRVGNTSGNSKTAGMDAKWKSVEDKESASDSMVIAVNGDTIRIQYPQSQETVDGKLNGSDSPVTGPTIPSGVTDSLKAEGADKLHFTIKYKSKTLDEGTQTLGDGGKTIIVEEWAPGKMAEKETLVYEKQ